MFIIISLGLTEVLPDVHHKYTVVVIGSSVDGTAYSTNPHDFTMKSH